MLFHSYFLVSLVLFTEVEWIMESFSSTVWSETSYRCDSVDSPAGWDLIKALVKVFNVNHVIVKDGRGII